MYQYILKALRYLRRLIIGPAYAISHDPLIPGWDTNFSGDVIHETYAHMDGQLRQVYLVGVHHHGAVTSFSGSFISDLIEVVALVVINHRPKLIQAFYPNGPRASEALLNKHHWKSPTWWMAGFNDHTLYTTKGNMMDVYTSKHACKAELDRCRSFHEDDCLSYDQLIEFCVKNAPELGL